MYMYLPISYYEQDVTQGQVFSKQSTAGLNSVFLLLDGCLTKSKETSLLYISLFLLLAEIKRGEETDLCLSQEH